MASESSMHIGSATSTYCLPLRIPSSQDLDWWNVFGQADISLTDSLTVTAGIKFEHNDISNWRREVPIPVA
jgi:hypothetical protein